MPELRDLYDERGASAQILQPPFAELLGRSRSRRHRNRLATSIGVAAFAALTAVPVLAVHGAGDQGAPSVSAPSSLPYSTGLVSWVDFHDPGHGVAGYLLGDECEGWLSFTQDGGESWSGLRELPPVSGESFPEGSDTPPPGDDPRCFAPRVIPVGGETLVMPVTLQSIPGREWVDPPTTSFISRDGGRSWQEYQPQLRTEEAVPHGVRLERHCVDTTCEQARLGWYDPATGDRVVLRHDPPVVPDGKGGGPLVASDGSIWLAGTGPDGDYVISVSRDRGRNWQTEPVVDLDLRTGDGDGGPGSMDGVGVVPTDGRTVYAALRQASGGRAETFLYRSDDGGGTWHRSPQPLPFDDVSAIWGSPDGALLVVDGSGVHRISTDGGKSFAAAAVPVWDVSPIVGGFFGSALDDSATDPIAGYLSEDGVTWQPVRIPRP